MQQLRTANFGKAFAGLTSGSVGYTLLNAAGTPVIDRATNVHEVLQDSGMYASDITFPSGYFHGTIVWDAINAFSASACAVEEFNIEANDPRVFETLSTMSSAVHTLVDVAVGRWKIENNQMLFFSHDDDNIPIAVFNLLDDKGMPNTENVFERRRA